ncbi:hypothetical protein EU538_04065 [Candidatus Thorarchaeota archaeon]|nr:MAG: hypothetical protein EU538_04065 [Candidatus Thorarchaeota archaeon]
MQDLGALALFLREISFGVFLAGLFYTFGMFILSRVFAAFGDHDAGEHDVDSAEHDIEHDVEHDYDHDIGHDLDHDIEHDVAHDFDHDVGHEIEHDIDHDLDHDIAHDLDHELDHDLDYGYDIDHDVDHEIDHEVDHDHGVEHEHDIDHDHHLETEFGGDVDHASGLGFFEMDRGAPLGVTIGTSLVSFGFIGSVIYYEGVLLPFLAKLLIQLVGAALIVFTVRTVLGKAFVESGFYIEPRHIVGRKVEAASTIRDDFGEIRAETEMGLRRFYARPFVKGVVFQKGTELFVVSADDKVVYVDPRKEAKKWVQQQSQKQHGK